MESQSVRTNRIHPLVAGAAVAVMAVSLLGMAAITGIISPSHGMVANPSSAPVAGVVPDNIAQVALMAGSNSQRYQAADGRVLEVVSHDAIVTPAPAIHHHQAHHYTQQTFRSQQQRYGQNSYSDVEPSYQSQPAYQAQPENQQPVQAHPVLNYVNDMHPVGTGVGAVVGGLLGNQIGGGNGRKIATLAGVLLGGYTGNEVAHNRNPLN